MQELLPLSQPIQEGKVRFENNIEEFRFATGDDPDAALRFLDAFRVRLSHSFDHLSSLSNSRTRLLAHQIEAAHIVVNAIKPRFLIADEVGLGKTIEAGLIIKELMFRRGYDNILICVPAPLMVQWQTEMKTRFNEDYSILGRGNFQELMKPRMRHARIITSIDFAKNPRYADMLLSQKWDLAIFDEAHRLRRDYNKITLAFAFAEKMAEKCEGLLLLSATPFRGKLEELFYLIRLLDPHVLGPLSSFLQEEMSGNRGDLRRRLSQILIRRRKIDVGGFTKRHAQTIRFDLSPEERAFYDETTDYVKREYNLAQQSENRAVGFVMMVFQKLLDSSTRALTRALVNRKMMLERLITSSPGLLDAPEDSEWEDVEKPEDLMGRVRDKRSLADVRKELLTIKRLLMLGGQIQSDRKLIKLRETMDLLKTRGSHKFVIFTQFKSTVDYLCDALGDWKVIPFHGSLRMAEKEKAIAEFREWGEVLISTEAGGEGRNLQFSNVLINYDLPWSPLKIEQRIGRIHRFGQQRDVYIFNFATRDTVSERVLEVLTNKIKLFEESIGPSDALLGAVQDEAEFQRDIMEFIANKKTLKEIEYEMAARLDTAKRGYAKLHTLVSPSKMNFNWDDYYNFTQKERKITNRIIQTITLSYLRANPQVATIERREQDFILRRGGVENLASFDSERALEKDTLEFLAIGHPIVEEAVESFLTRKLERTIHSIHMEGRSGFYFIFSGHFSMATVELFSAFCPESNPTRVETPDELLIPPGFEPHDGNGIPAPGQTDEEADRQLLRKSAIAAWQAILARTESRRLELEKSMKGAFVSEEMKIETSHGKQLRGLREKQDIQKMRATISPVFEFKASLARTEKEISRTQASREIELEKVRRMSRIHAEVELLQVFRFLG
ncbi:MAG: DEAD/DEAH box helicase family protein [Leptospirales bacterium]|nr:DEAD/DEAH box helicase family protein [Leptospirales bacterium]